MALVRAHAHWSLLLSFTSASSAPTSVLVSTQILLANFHTAALVFTHANFSSDRTVAMSAAIICGLVLWIWRRKAGKKLSPGHNEVKLEGVADIELPDKGLDSPTTRCGRGSVPFLVKDASMSI